MADDTIAHEDILKMAAECGFPVNWQHPDVRAIKVKRFVDFANLVAAAELRRLHEANQLMLNTLRWIDKLCPDEFHYFDKQKPGLQRVLAKMAYDAGGLARSTIEKVEEI